MAEGDADLVIGIGNLLRGDDGVGCWLAARAEMLPPPPHTGAGRIVKAVQQLTPELSEDLAEAGRVLFIDAWWPGRAAWAEPLQGQIPKASAVQPSIPVRQPLPSKPIESPADRQTASDAGPSEGLRQTILPAAISSPPDRACLHRLARADVQVEAGAFSHRLDPAQLLAITALLHGRAPQGWILMVPAWAMPHGACFSPQVAALLPQAEALLGRWCAGAIGQGHGALRVGAGQCHA